MDSNALVAIAISVIFAFGVILILDAKEEKVVLYEFYSEAGFDLLGDGDVDCKKDHITDHIICETQGHQKMECVKYFGGKLKCHAM